MPRGNRFRHQCYTAEAPASPYELLRPAGHSPLGSNDFIGRMQAVGDALRAANVAAIYLVHGTFAGCDALGIFTEVERYLPWLSSIWRAVTKQMTDAVFHSVGNYTAAYAKTLEESINRPGERHIAVRRFAWSGENHHIGRADAAVRLIDELASALRNAECGMRNDQDRLSANSAFRIPHPEFPRLLLWGHSHAGNVFALMSHLLAGDADSLRAFFAATRVYRRRLFGRRELAHWQRVEDLLGARDSALRTPHSALDFVTFGTPIRYGWDGGGYARLLHFVNHRPLDGSPPYRATFPPRERDVRAGAGGDYVQQLGIAGTNLLPNPLSYRALLADLRLGRLLQAGIRRRDLPSRLRHGMRVPDEGTTLLVDYGLPRCNVVQHLAGHGVYTRPEWMLFHAEETARRLYGRGDNPSRSS